MPQATQTLSLTLNAVATTYNLAQRGVGVPTLWTRAIAGDGSLVAQETISHNLKRASSNQNVTIEGRLPTLIEINGVSSVKHTGGVKTVLNIPLTMNTAEKTRLCDLAIKGLEAFRAGIIAGESFF